MTREGVCFLGKNNISSGHKGGLPPPSRHSSVVLAVVHIANAMCAWPARVYILMPAPPMHLQGKAVARAHLPHCGHAPPPPPWGGFPQRIFVDCQSRRRFQGMGRSQ